MEQDNKIMNKYEKKDLRKVWAIEIDLLEKIKEICEKYNLHYCASSGTLLGAVRHHGFIPWDDDIDIFLMWDDYKKLMEIASEECTYPYCFQSIYTEKYSMPSACRLRRSDTTGFTLWEYNNVPAEYDRGIFIDIFPLFYVPDSMELRVQQKKEVIYYWECIHGFDAVEQQNRGGYVNPDYEKLIPSYEDYCSKLKTPFDIVRLKEQYLNACAFHNVPEKEVGATSSRCHDPKLMWQTDWYSRYVEMPFENTTITCPIGYEKILEKQYGDWKTPVENGGMHEMVIIDTEKAWKEYPKDKLCKMAEK